MSRIDSCILLLSDARGIYIPRDFAQDFRFAGMDGLTEESPNVVKGCSPEDVETCRKGPDEEWYWEAWDSILNNAEWTDEEGNRYTLHQDGDLWALCSELMTKEEKENFGFDTSDMEDEEEDGETPEA